MPPNPDSAWLGKGTTLVVPSSKENAWRFSAWGSLFQALPMRLRRAGFNAIRAGESPAPTPSCRAALGLDGSETRPHTASA